MGSDKGWDFNDNLNDPEQYDDPNVWFSAFKIELTGLTG